MVSNYICNGINLISQRNIIINNSIMFNVRNLEVGFTDRK